MDPAVDPAVALCVDLSAGHLQRQGLGRVLALPLRLLHRLLTIEPERGQGWGTEWGELIGAAVWPQLGGATEAPSVQGVTDVLAAEFALAGLGQLTLEQWGRALVVVVRGSELGEQQAPFLSGVLQGALRRGFARPVCVVTLESTVSAVRLLVCGAAAAEQVRRGIGAGLPWHELLVRLHQVGEAA
jgi:hypothetical protein